MPAVRHGRARLVNMPGTLPDGEPVPRDGALPAGVAGRGGGGRVRRLRARPVLRQPLRLLRLQHLHRRPSSAAAPRRGLRRRGPGASSPWPRRCWSAPRPRCDTVFFGGGTPTLLPPDDLGRILDGIDAHVRAGRRRRGDHRGQPGVGRPRPPARAAGGRLHPDLARHAVRRAGTCWRCWTAGTRPGRAAAAVAEARAAGFEHVNLDLIYGTPGRDAPRLRRLAGRR